VLERLRVPKALGALLLILVVIATIVGLGAAISGPAQAWIAKLPEGIPHIQERLSFLDAPINTLRTFLAAANNFGAAGPQQSSAGPLDGGAILSSVFAGTRSFAGGLFTTVMFLYFLLVFRGTVSCGGRSKSCPGLQASGRRSTSHSKSDATFPLISSQLP
jgi:predicted PurR-regulated permease PerM